MSGSLNSFKHRMERLRISQSVLGADNEQGRFRQPTVLEQLAALRDGDGLIGCRVQDHRLRLDGGDCAPPLPGWAQQDERGRSRVEVHGDRAAAARPYNHLWTVLVKVS